MSKSVTRAYKQSNADTASFFKQNEFSYFSEVIQLCNWAWQKNVSKSLIQNTHYLVNMCLWVDIFYTQI